MGAPLPPAVESLLWGVDVHALDLAKHRDFVFERIMCRGSLDAMRWLRATYSCEELAAFLEAHGTRIPPRDRAYWRLVAGLPPSDEPGGARPAWIGRRADR